jgi:hypothetical protein
LKLPRINARTVLLIIVEAMLIFFAMLTAVYLRLGVLGAEEQLLRSYGFYKIASNRSGWPGSRWRWSSTPCRNF